MATITSKELIDRLIKDNGYFPGDPRVVKIVEYHSSLANNINWGVIWENEINKNRYDFETDYIKEPKIIWEAK